MVFLVINALTIKFVSMQSLRFPCCLLNFILKKKNHPKAKHRPPTGMRKPKPRISEHFLALESMYLCNAWGRFLIPLISTEITLILGKYEI
jgi:hypothetical protein